MSKRDSEDDDWSVESDYAPSIEGQEGPPKDWKYPSWHNPKTGQWYFNGRLDPCPVTPLGHDNGIYEFVTPSGEVRRFTASALHGRGGPSDLFGGVGMRWARRHFRKYDVEKESLVGRLQQDRCMEYMVDACLAKGLLDKAAPRRSVGTWRGPDGRPIVHAGDKIFHNGRVLGPGALIGDTLYVIGGQRSAPAHERGHDGSFAWTPANVTSGHTLTAHLDEWHWQDLEARDLFLGGLWCDMLGDALAWKPHKFVRAIAGSGKSTLLEYTGAVLGGAAHPVQTSYSKAWIEDHFSHTCCALLFDEAESGVDVSRVQRMFELVLLLSDKGATGGRFKREIDLHGTITMVATLTEDWAATVKSRMAYLELRPLRARLDRPPAKPEEIAAIIKRAGEMSAGLRARAIVRFDLFKQNLELARVRILELGGDPRDAAQLGHLIAGWATATSDSPMIEEEVRALDRFAPYILTLKNEDDGGADADELLNTLLGLPADFYRGGERFTIGQLIARARGPDGDQSRRALLPYGLRLERLTSEVTGIEETWAQAWLAVATKHPGLDKLFTDYPSYRGVKRGQILSALRRVIDGETFEAKPSGKTLRFAGPQSRAWLIPAALLPSEADEKQPNPSPSIDDGGKS